MIVEVTVHAVERARERAGWEGADRIRDELAEAKHLGVSRDGLEVWRAGSKANPGPLILVEAHGLALCRPSRIVVVTVLNRDERTLEAIALAKSRPGEVTRGWRRTHPLPDLWAARGAEA